MPCVRQALVEGSVVTCPKQPAPAPPFVWIEEKGETGWARHTRFRFPCHPVYAKDQIRLLKKSHPGTEYRLVEEDIPF